MTCGSKEGERGFPSVTEVLKPYEDFSRIAPETLEAAADRGLLLHSVLARHALGLWIAPEEVPEKFQGYFDSGRRWLDRYVVKVHLAEKKLVDKDRGYQGTPDIICILKRDKDLSLWDFKSGQIILPTWEAQIGGYYGLTLKNNIDIRRAGCLRLQPDGKLPKVAEMTDRLNYLLMVFHACLTVHKFFKEK
jgi:hypothetical protein